jgi:hypothetical protein
MQKYFENELIASACGESSVALTFSRRYQFGERLARHHGAGGIGRASDQHPFQRRPVVRGEQGFAGQGVAGFRRGLDQHRFAAKRGQDMAIRRIAGHRDRDPVARLEHCKKGQDEGARRSGGDDNPFGIDGTAVNFAVMPRDALAQRRDPERGGVVDPPAVERGVSGRDRGFRCGGRRLSDFHVDDVAAGAFDPRRRRHHVHHHEGRNVASAGGGQQVPRAVSQCRIKHRYLLSFQTPHPGRIPRFVRAYPVTAPPPIHIKPRCRSA